MSGFAFGLIIGFLSWYAFRPGETPDTVPLQKIGALLAIVGGATVLTLFPMGTIYFEYYSLGLAIGFFFTPIKKWFSKVLETASTWLTKIINARKTQYLKEIEAINAKWLEVDRIVRHKLENSSRVDEMMPNSNFIDIIDLQELQYTQPLVEYIMRRFAENHVRDGIEYRTAHGKPALFKARW